MFLARNIGFDQALACWDDKDEMLNKIWYHLYNLKHVKNTHGVVLLLVLKVTLPHVCFSRF